MGMVTRCKHCQFFFLYARTKRQHEEKCAKDPMNTFVNMPDSLPSIEVPEDHDMQTFVRFNHKVQVHGVANRADLRRYYHRYICDEDKDNSYAMLLAVEEVPINVVKNFGCPKDTQPTDLRSPQKKAESSTVEVCLSPPDERRATPLQKSTGTPLQKRKGTPFKRQGTPAKKKLTPSKKEGTTKQNANQVSRPITRSQTANKDVESKKRKRKEGPITKLSHKWSDDSEPEIEEYVHEEEREKHTFWGHTTREEEVDTFPLRGARRAARRCKQISYEEIEERVKQQKKLYPISPQKMFAQCCGYAEYRADRPVEKQLQASWEQNPEKRERDKKLLLK